MAKTTFIVYQSDSEILVTTPKQESDFLTEYGPYRNFEQDFDRTEYESSQVRIGSSLNFSD